MSKVYDDERKQKLYEQIVESMEQCKQTGATFEFWWKHLQELFSSNPLFEEIEKDVAEAYEAATLFPVVKFTTVNNPILTERLKAEYGCRLRQFKCPFLGISGYMLSRLPKDTLMEFIIDAYLWNKYMISDFYFEEDWLEQAFVITKACTLIKAGYTIKDFVFLLDVREFSILKEVFSDDIDVACVDSLADSNLYYKLVRDEAVYTNMITTMKFEDWYHTFIANMEYFASVSLTIEELS